MSLDDLATGRSDPASTETERAIRSRQSCRRYLPREVSTAVVEQLLTVARWAPSNGNTQPWRVYVVGGEVREAISREITQAVRAGEEGEAEYRYYPEQWFEPYLARRRACGWGLYGALGIERGERERALEQNLRNFSFFDAAVGLFLTIDRRLEHGSWIDLGAFLQSFCVAARSRGLATCPQAAFSDYHRIIRRHLPIPDEEIVVCGIALGYPDESAPENVWRAEREPISTFVSWHGVEAEL